MIMIMDMDMDMELKVLESSCIGNSLFYEDFDSYCVLLGKVHGMSSSGSGRNGCKLCSILTYMSIVIVLFNLIVLII